MINKNDVLERVSAIYTGKYKSESQFAKSISINQKTLNQQLRGERSLSLDTVIYITIIECPDISPDSYKNNPLYPPKYTKACITAIIHNRKGAEYTDTLSITFIKSLIFLLNFLIINRAASDR